MSNVVTFTLAGQPTGKGRPRFGGGAVYTPAKTAAAENNVAYAATQAMAGRAPMDGPITAEIVSSFPVPASWNAKTRDAALRGTLRPTKKPDADNIAKLVCDACNQIVYRDDAQVVRLTIRKVYADTPGLTATFQQTIAA